MASSAVSVGRRSGSDRLIPPPGIFEIDPVHTFVTFRVQHTIVGRVQGRFDMVTGTVTVGENGLHSRAELSIDTGSIATRRPIRADSVHSYEFIEVANYQSLTFRSTETTEFPSGGWSVTGDLTISGVTATTDFIVDLSGAVSDPFGTLRIGFHATTTVSRRPLDVLLNLESHTKSLSAAREVTIEIDGEAVHHFDPTAVLSDSSLRGIASGGNRSIRS